MESQRQTKLTRAKEVVSFFGNVMWVGFSLLACILVAKLIWLTQFIEL